VRVGAAKMHRARHREPNPQPAGDRGASAPRSTPLTIVSGAVAGDGLERVAGSASDAIGRPVAIAIPALGEPVVWPPGAIAADGVREIVEHAAAMIRGDRAGPPPVGADTVEVRIGREVLGVVAAVGVEPDQGIAPDGSDPHDCRAWLEGAAAAAAVTKLMREAHEGSMGGSRRALLQALGAGPPADLGALLAHARRLGFDLGSGAVAICAQVQSGGSLDDLPAKHQALLADLGGGHVLGLVPLASALPVQATAESLATDLAARGMEVALSAPRRDPAALHEALREARLLVELGALLAGQEETYRLLIGVLLRDAGELEQLRESTISPLVAYDRQHDTELVATLQAFLAHHGSTSETAEAMSLHRHTVGYRLSRVHEVSGLSPYESDGRERLSLGLKADQILAADKRRDQHR
jgi:PucR C-terminal helix-turn-helix domain/GGDEF-like domain